MSKEEKIVVVSNAGKSLLVLKDMLVRMGVEPPFEIVGTKLAIDDAIEPIELNNLRTVDEFISELHVIGMGAGGGGGRGLMRDLSITLQDDAYCDWDALTATRDRPSWPQGRAWGRWACAGERKRLADAQKQKRQAKRQAKQKAARKARRISKKAK